MGVPGFFLWLWKTYKAKNFVFTKAKIPDDEDISNIDYFLLDMNCMIHPICFETLKEENLSGKDAFANIIKLENKMMNNVIQYLEKVILLANSKKGVYLAIDGVAPVAKMKQQRMRRFKSIKDKELFDNIRRKHKKPIPFFWSNSAITPGTQFMKRLTEKINEWAVNYSKTNSIDIIFSPSSIPAEGEHKLLQFIRNQKQAFNYVVYGLDADLIFLMLSTKLDSIYLMREGNNMDNKKSEEMNFVSIKKMKECIIDSVKKLLENITLALDNNRIIDDFIFICYLMGNDFLPHIPALDIYENAIDTLLENYVENVLMEGNYIIDRKDPDYINDSTFYNFMLRLASTEEQTIVESYGKKKYKKVCPSTDPFDIEMHKIENMQFRVNDDIKLGEGNMIEWRFRHYNHHYHVDEDELDEFTKNMVYHYNVGLKWVTMYYFDKCPSWDWYYIYDHAPFLNDMVKEKFNFKSIEFKLGNPVTPFEQLLIVLPKESAFLLPLELRKIMLNPNSSAAHLYPDNFELDMIGKKKYWMCHPILPNLEINLIKKMFEKYLIKLNENDKKINSIGKPILFNNYKLKIDYIL
jgi:5'-3' exoribonuclease 2